MKIRVKLYFISIFSPFQVFNDDLIMYTQFVPISKLQAQYLTMLHNRSRTEYLIPVDNIQMLLLHLNLILKSNLIGGFSKHFNDN